MFKNWLDFQLLKTKLPKNGSKIDQIFNFLRQNCLEIDQIFKFFNKIAWKMFKNSPDFQLLKTKLPKNVLKLTIFSTSYDKIDQINKIAPSLGQFLADFEKNGPKKVYFWPIYAKNGHFWTILGQFLANSFFKKRGGQFWTILGQFFADLCKKWPFFLGKTKEANFG